MDFAVCDKCVQFTQLFGVVDEIRQRGAVIRGKVFLHNLQVPATNNEAERLLRGYKRKQKQAVTFRSFESIDYLCQYMSILVMMRQKEYVNLFDRVSQIFG